MGKKKDFQIFISGTVHQVLKYNKYKIMLKKISVYVQILKSMQQQQLPLVLLILKLVLIVTNLSYTHGVLSLNWDNWNHCSSKRNIDVYHM